MTEPKNAALIADMLRELDERQEWEGEPYTCFRPHRANMRWSTRAIMAEAENDRLLTRINHLETTDLADELNYNLMLWYTIEELSAEIQRLEQQLSSVEFH